jgi:hypothetical protein
MTGDDRGSDKGQLGPGEPGAGASSSGGDRRELNATAEALAAAHQGGETDSCDSPSVIDSADHELLIAMTLGEEAAIISEPERERARALCDALGGHRADPLAELAEALHLAYQSGEGGPAEGDLSQVDHEVLIALATGGPIHESLRDAEGEGAEALRAALDGEGSDPLADLAGALRMAAGQGMALDELSHERLLRRGMQGAQTGREAERQAPSAPRRAAPGGGMVLAAVLALAAGVALFFGSLSWLETRGTRPVAEGPQLPAPAVAALVLSRSTQDLFDPAIPFPSKGGESDRLAKIVASRAADLRSNRFAAWGVR